MQEHYTRWIEQIESLCGSANVGMSMSWLIKPPGMYPYCRPFALWNRACAGFLYSVQHQKRHC